MAVQSVRLDVRERLRDYLMYRLRRLEYEWRLRGFLAHIHVAYDVARLVFLLGVQLDGFERQYVLTEDELYMGRDRAIDHIFQIIELDIRRYLDDDRDAVSASGPNMTATEVLARRDEAFARMRAEQHRIRERMDTRSYEDAWQRLADAFLPTKEDSKANEKAMALFRSMAGEKAFKILESGKALPIKGSLGTAYTLHKRATFCVERPADGAKLCAVVPGVPLWDHLLGIKLMVEHDEPKFLATANVAGAINIRPGAINYAYLGP